MKKAILFICLAFISLPLLAGKWYSITSDKPAPAKVHLVSSDIKTSVLEFTLGGFSVVPVSTPRGISNIINVEGSTPMLSKGNPDLPKLTSSIIIPDQANMEVEVVEALYKEYNNIVIAPSKGNFSRDIDPSTIPFTYGPTYTKNRFYPSELTSMREPYIMRDIRGQTVIANVFQYNPVTNVLRVYYQLKLKIKSNGINLTNSFDGKNTVKKLDREFKEVYNSHFLNYDNDRYTPVEEQGKMLIICYSSFMPSMLPFVEWKKSEGIPVEMVSAASIGNSQAIKTYVTNYYNEHGLTYLLLVGDHSQVPCYQATSGYSDNSYSYVSGNDHYPDLFVGRFSAETVEQVETQVNKVLYYEINPSLASNWMETSVGVASDLGSGDDNEYDYEHIRNLQVELESFTYQSRYEYFDGSQGGFDAAGNPSPSQVAAGINSGSSCVLYCGHGSQSGWGSSGFSSSDVNQLANTGKLPFVISVACVNGDFTNGTCFAEAWLRAHNGTELRGAVATLMSTINQSWSPPMEGQDEMIAILAESDSNNIKRTFGGITMNGCMKMNDTYGSDGYEMTDTWNLFGDPSIMIRTAQATQITATHPSTVLIGVNSFQLSCNEEGAFACITLNGEILGTAYVLGGSATINLSQPLNLIDTLKLVITAFNHIPYITTVPIIAASGPFVAMNNYLVIDQSGNNNNLPDFGENITLDLTLQNLGVAMANSVNATISANTPDLTITDNVQSFGNINTNTSSTQNNAYAISIANNVADQTVVPVSIVITDNNSNIWNSNFNMILNAPSLVAGSIVIDDALGGNNNSNLDPGESVNILIPVLNIGHSDAPNTIGTLSSTNSLITITNGNYALNTVIVNGTVNAIFTLSVSQAATYGSTVVLDFTANSGAYNAQKTFHLNLGIVDEDFETNNFTQYNWINTSAIPWKITNVNPYEGLYCAKSGAISHNNSTELKITFDVLTEDSISFYRKVSSEQDFDLLMFYIDNTKKEEWSGEKGWERKVYAVSAGTHTFRWIYEKDFWGSSNSDAAWIDYIVFPPVSMGIGIDQLSKQASTLNVYPNPSNELINVDLFLNECSDAEVYLSDITGRSIMTINRGKLNAGLHSWQINSLDYSPGIYFLNLIVNEEKQLKKVLIAR